MTGGTPPLQIIAAVSSPPPQTNKEKSRKIHIVNSRKNKMERTLNYLAFRADLPYNVWNHVPSDITDSVSSKPHNKHILKAIGNKMSCRNYRIAYQMASFLQTSLRCASSVALEKKEPSTAISVRLTCQFSRVGMGTSFLIVVSQKDYNGIYVLWNDRKAW